ncbi:ankyrin-2-like isoform X2 [Stylophora pistillata]|uniref:ankyrin-2-like isoform X2 n=1 Tax=Stylophora pistillata TaxID=50429 RepID=UPI000C03B508|nr:ankyrin-2-like isoform X2 [Stylophora pistillata]
MDVLSKVKKWLVTLVTLNKVVAPVLPDIVKQGMENLYAFLDNFLNGLATPCSLATLTYTDVCHLAVTPSPVSSLKDLYFGNINNNSDIHGKKTKKYNYNVSSPVDLAKLYLPNFLAVFSAFDQSMDLSAALRLLGSRKYPMQIYVSSDPLYDIKSLADDVRENVRNRASHFGESEWTQIFFDQCFDKLKNLVQGLPLNVAKKKELLDQLSEWKAEGFQRIIDEDVKEVMEKFQNAKLAAIDEKLDDIPTKEEREKATEKLLSFLRSMIDRFEDLFRKVEHKLDGISVKPLSENSRKSVHPTRSSVLSTDVTSKEMRQIGNKYKNPESTGGLRAKIAKLSRGTLHKAAISGRRDFVELLLENGEDVDQRDEFNLTPLHLAAWYGKRAVVELLLRHGANVNAVDRFQKTALQKAERNNHRTIVELLLRNNATPSYNQPPSLRSLSRKAFLHVDPRSGFNRLQAAVFHGDFDTFLKAQGCLENYVQDMNFQKTGSQANIFPGKTASQILLALQEKGEGNVEMGKLYKDSVEKSDTLTELHLCRTNDDAERAVEIVLNEGEDINIPGKSNRTPLLWASQSSSGEFVQTLVDLGADVNAQRTDDKVPTLTMAADWNNYTATDILLRHGALVDIQDGDGWTPLHCCASRRLSSVSQLLMDFGCDINLRTNNGQTLLFFAVKNKHEHLVKCLLERNADVNLKYKENASERIYLVEGKDRGKPSWHYVLAQKALLPLFLKRAKGGSLDVGVFGEVLTSGRGRDPPESVTMKITEKANTFPDIHGLTVLHFASMSGTPEIIELLVKNNADINGCDGDGFTPLHLAAIHGNVPVVKKLVELNADVNLKVDGNDAADLAHMNKETEIEEFLKTKRSSPLKDTDI